MLTSFFQCSCTTHLLALQYDKEFKQFYFCFYIFGNLRISLKQKLRYIWKILTTGEIYADQVVLTKKDAMRMANLIFAEHVKNAK